MANAIVGAERTPQNTKVIHDVLDLDAAPSDYVRPVASVATAGHGHITLGIVVGPRRCITDQLLAKADVIGAMHARIQQCQEPQTEFALLRESLGVSRINHIPRVHGHPILHEDEVAKTFEVGQRSLERRSPRFTEDSTEQAALSAGQSVVGYKRSADVARPAHFGALIAAKPQILDTNRGAATAGLHGSADHNSKHNFPDYDA